MNNKATVRNKKAAVTSHILNEGTYDAFVIIKPGFIEKKDEIIRLFSDRGFVLVDLIEKRMTKPQAEALYNVHRHKEFFEELVDYMISDISIGMVFKSPYKDKEEAVEAVNEVKAMLRKEGKDTMRNVIHASDSVYNVAFESKIYFEYGPHLSEAIKK